MKFLKTIFTNALVLATLVTVLAGTILVGYASHDAAAEGRGPGIDQRRDDGVPQSPMAPTWPNEEVPYGEGAWWRAGGR